MLITQANRLWETLDKKTHGIFGVKLARVCQEDGDELEEFEEGQFDIEGFDTKPVQYGLIDCTPDILIQFCTEEDNMFANIFVELEHVQFEELEGEITEDEYQTKLERDYQYVFDKYCTPFIKELNNCKRDIEKYAKLRITDTSDVMINPDAYTVGFSFTFEDLLSE